LSRAFGLQQTFVVRCAVAIGGHAHTPFAHPCTGNQATVQQVIRVVDNEPPVLTVPPDKQLKCFQSLDVNNTGTATGTSMRCFAFRCPTVANVRVAPPPQRRTTATPASVSRSPTRLSPAAVRRRPRFAAPGWPLTPAGMYLVMEHGGADMRCSNRAEKVQVITIVDDVPPVLTIPVRTPTSQLCKGAALLS
jgi:hypothetical protein